MPARVGIDLGTTYSLVATIQDGRPVVLPNVLGKTQTPSAVSIADDGFDRILDAVSELAAAARAIREAVDRQQQTGSAIESHARDTAAYAENMLADIGSISSAAQETENLSSRVEEAASNLADISARLKAATGEFVGKLKAA